MYQFLALIGPGALSFLIIQHFMKDKDISLIHGIAQIMSLSLINNVIALLALMSFSKTTLIFNEDGTSYVQYGPVDIVFLMVIAMLLSFVIVIIRNHIAMDIKVEDKNEEKQK